jgi:hypothetical protein
MQMQHAVAAPYALIALTAAHLAAALAALAVRRICVHASVRRGVEFSAREAMAAYDGALACNVTSCQLI